MRIKTRTYSHLPTCRTSSSSGWGRRSGWKWRCTCTPDGRGQSRPGQRRRRRRWRSTPARRWAWRTRRATALSWSWPWRRAVQTADGEPPPSSWRGPAATVWQLVGGCRRRRGRGRRGVWGGALFGNLTEEEPRNEIKIGNRLSRLFESTSYLRKPTI